ncbi:uncharacterized protein LOC144548867 [Carex rostrata]
MAREEGNKKTKAKIRQEAKTWIPDEEIMDCIPLRVIFPGEEEAISLQLDKIHSSTSKIKYRKINNSPSQLAIGTPPRPYALLLDTGSGLIWTQCKPCSRCAPQSSPIFDPFKSSTFSRLPCSNKLCQDLDSNSTKHHCMYSYLVCLWRSIMYVWKLFKWFGTQAEIYRDIKAIGTVPRAQGPNSSLWIVQETSALLSNMKLPLSNISNLPLDCFSSPSILPSQVKAPKVILHFEGIDMNLAHMNYLLDYDEQGLLCLAMRAATNLFGVLRQQDLKNSKLAKYFPFL